MWTKEYTKEYHKKWKKEHPESVKKWYKKWYQEHKEEKKNYSQKHKKRIKEYNKKWAKENKEKLNEYQKKWAKEHRKQLREIDRKTKIVTGGKKYSGLKKREYPIDNKCELCEEVAKRLVYHHWDDNDLQKGKNVKGIWICNMCHQFVEFIEKHSDYQKYSNKYLKLKEKINETTPNNEKIS